MVALALAANSTLDGRDPIREFMRRYNDEASDSTDSGENDNTIVAAEFHTSAFSSSGEEHTSDESQQTVFPNHSISSSPTSPESASQISPVKTLDFVPVISPPTVQPTNPTDSSVPSASPAPLILPNISIPLNTTQQVQTPPLNLPVDYLADPLTYTKSSSPDSETPVFVVPFAPPNSPCPSGEPAFTFPPNAKLNSHKRPVKLGCKNNPGNTPSSPKKLRSFSHRLFEIPPSCFHLIEISAYSIPDGDYLF